MYIDVNKIEKDYNRDYDKLIKSNKRKYEKLQIELDCAREHLINSYLTTNSLYYELTGDKLEWIISRDIYNTMKEIDSTYPDISDNWYNMVEPGKSSKILYDYFLKDTTKSYKKYLKLKDKLDDNIKEYNLLIETKKDNNPFYEYEYNNCDKFSRDVIYVLVFPDHRFYVGQTTRCLDTRIKEHALKIKNPRTKKEIAISRLKKFVVWVVYQCNSYISIDDKLDKLNKMERVYIEHFNSYHNGYNSTIDGQSAK